MRITLSVLLISIASIAFGQQTTELENTRVRSGGQIRATSVITEIGTQNDPTPTVTPASPIELPNITTDPIGETITPPTNVIDTLRIKKDLNTIRFSLGTYYNADLETNIVNSSQKYGLNLAHNSNQIGATNDWNSKRYFNKLNGWTKLKPLGKFDFKNTISFQNLGTYFYGNENFSTVNLNKDNEINYDKWNYEGNLSNDEIRSIIKWDATIEAGQLNGMQGLKELNLTGRLDLKFPIEKIKGLEFALNNKLIKSTFDYSTTNLNRSIFYSQPNIIYKTLKYSIIGGLTYINEEQIESKAHLFPKFEFNYKLNKYHQIAAGITGDVQFNGFSSLINENVYLANNQSYFQNTVNPTQVYTILKGGNTINNKEGGVYSYLIKVKYATLNNLPIYVNGSRNTERDPLYFYVEYLGKNNAVSNLQIDATLYNKFNQQWSNTLYLKSDNYSGDLNYSNIILKPLLDLSNKINFNGANWDFALSFNYISGLYGFQTKENKVVKMDDIALVNLSGSYQFNESFRMYGNLNNVLNQKYQRIINYREIGFNFNAGILYEF